MAYYVLWLNALLFMWLFFTAAWDWWVDDTEEAMLPCLFGGIAAAINIAALAVG